MIYKSFNQKQKRASRDLSAAIIRYNEGFDHAPMVVAQARGDQAKQIIKLAKEQNIPLQEDTQLIGELIDMDLGDSIPPQLYSVMAEIFLLLQKMEKST